MGHAERLQWSDDREGDAQSIASADDYFVEADVVGIDDDLIGGDWLSPVQQGDPEVVSLLRPYRMLFSAILFDAIQILKVYVNRSDLELYQETMAWLLADDPDDDWPGTFLNVCKVLDLPPRETRARILRGLSAGRVPTRKRMYHRAMRMVSRR